MLRVLRFLILCFNVSEMRMALAHVSEAILEILVPQAHDVACGLAVQISDLSGEVQSEGELHQLWCHDGWAGVLIWNF